jgi:hypothetical protein
VDGASDLLYIEALSSILIESGREGLKSAWTVTPVGGADKVPTFVALIGSQKALRVATLIDFQKSNAQMIENLYKRKLLNKSYVLTFADFTGKSEADIEDMFEREFYLKLLNAEYKKQLANPIALSDLNAHCPRFLTAIEKHLRQHPLKSGGFDHYRPARYFVENVGKLGKDLSPETLHRFEAAFKALNALLN